MPWFCVAWSFPWVRGVPAWWGFLVWSGLWLFGGMGHAFGLPGRDLSFRVWSGVPWPWVVRVCSCVACGRVGRWVENWIVDASGPHRVPPLWGVGVVCFAVIFFFAGCLLFGGVWSIVCDHDDVLMCCPVVRGCLVAGGAACWVVLPVKGVWWMPWRTGPMKDVWGRDRPRGAADRALIRGCPNGETRQS